MLRIATLSICTALLLGSCGTKLSNYDEFTGITTERSKSTETINKAFSLQSLAISAIKESGGEDGTRYGIEVTAGLGINEYSFSTNYPEIQAGDSLQLIIDDERYSFTKEGDSYHQVTVPGLTRGWRMESARYMNVPEDLFSKIVKAEEVKIRVLCKSRGEFAGKLKPGNRDKLAAFVQAHLDPTVEAPAKPKKKRI